ncbi:ISL3 family transposase [Mariniplasma anaerobium]|uniref:ISL3 family transposase n=1 Tax=Mariniplasma anaerobium TaxID=2735436 RepID=A0A7U9TIS3_9MOLU|nr:ISL3 family transposase [Mariniplasma anaerobium]BCR35529.1 ISL3 family transposase [Mariniplasma anaerobium]
MNDDTIKLLNLEHIDHLIESISSISLEGLIEMHIKLFKSPQTCPNCLNETERFHSFRIRSITHSVLIDKKYLLIYHARRYKCLCCGKVFYEKNPFSKRYESISTYTKLSILEHLKDYTHTFTSAANAYFVSKQSVINIFDHFVDARRRLLPEVICMDEFYTSKVSKYKYACVLFDFRNHKLIDIYPTRHKNYLIKVFSRFPKAEKIRVKAFVIDMWPSYKEVIERAFPHALIAVDSFHIIRNLNEAIRHIRIEVMNKYKSHKSNPIHEDMYYYMLKKFHYFFLKNYENVYDGKIRIQKLQTSWHKSTILDYLLSIDDILKSAYRLKERYQEFNLTAEYETCDEELDDLIRLFKNHDHQLFRDFGKMIQRWKIEIKNSFYRVDNRRLSNGPIEGVNSRIKTVIKSSNGIKNFYRLRNRLIFSINKDVPIKLK